MTECSDCARRIHEAAWVLEQNKKLERRLAKLLEVNARYQDHNNELIRKVFAFERQLAQVVQDPECGWHCVTCHLPLDDGAGRRRTYDWYLVGFHAHCCSLVCFNKACWRLFDTYVHLRKERKAWHDATERLRRVRRYLNNDETLRRPNRRGALPPPSGASRPAETSRT